MLLSLNLDIVNISAKSSDLIMFDYRIEANGGRAPSWPTYTAWILLIIELDWMLARWTHISRFNEIHQDLFEFWAETETKAGRIPGRLTYLCCMNFLHYRTRLRYWPYEPIFQVWLKLIKICLRWCSNQIANGQNMVNEHTIAASRAKNLREKILAFERKVWQKFHSAHMNFESVIKVRNLVSQEIEHYWRCIA